MYAFAFKTKQEKWKLAFCPSEDKLNKLVEINSPFYFFKDFPDLEITEENIPFFHIILDENDFPSDIEFDSAEQAEVKNEIVREHLGTYREQKIAEGTTVNGVVIEGDLVTQVRLAGARIEAEADPNYSVDWKAVNGKVILTAAQVIGLSSAFRAHVQKCFDAYFAVAENLANYSTPEQVEQAFDTAYAAL